METNDDFPFPICTNVPPDIAESSTIIEEGPRICPLCNSIVRMFFINLNEQIQMCENTECEFPFGYEEVQYVRQNIELDDDDKFTIATKPTGTLSVVSSIAWAEIEKMTRDQEDEDAQFDNRDQENLNDRDRYLEELNKKKEADMKLKEKVDNIRSLTREWIRDDDDTARPYIKDRQLISNLKNLQDRLGCQLLKEDEMVKVKRMDPCIGLGELKIDIGASADNISSITIALTSQSSDENNPKQ